MSSVGGKAYKILRWLDLSGGEEKEGEAVVGKVACCWLEVCQYKC